MTNSLSRFAGGGLVYTPAMMQFDGSTGYYSLVTTLASSQTVTVLARVNNTLSAAGRIISANVPQDVLVFQVQAAGLVQLQVRDTGGTVICNVLSSVAVNDGGNHMVMAAYNATAGTAVVFVDGVSVLDTGAPGHVLTTGTIRAGAQTFGVGANPAGSAYYTGSIGYVALDWGRYETDPSTWMNGKYPLSASLTAWDIANVYGYMEDNVGTEATFTKNGGIVVGAGGNGPHPLLGLSTVGDAVAANITTGKVAWVNGVQIIGTL